MPSRWVKMRTVGAELLGGMRVDGVSACLWCFFPVGKLISCLSFPLFRWRAPSLPPSTFVSSRAFRYHRVPPFLGPISQLSRTAFLHP